MSKPTLNPALRSFWEQPARGRVLYGGRNSTKSWDAAGMAIFLASNFTVRFLCTRQFQNKIAESVYTLLKIQIERFGLSDEFNITDKSIEHKRTGSNFVFYGLARNISEIRSLEGVDVWWIEEAHFLTKEQWDTVEPTVRKEGSQIWAIFNPMYASDFAYQRLVVNPPPKYIVRKINYDENPFISQTSLDMIERCKAESQEDYEHIYLGNPKQDTEGTVIKRSWIEAAIDAHLKLGFEPAGRKVIGFDVADDGEDACANVYSHGSVALWCDEWRAAEDELLKSCSRTFQNAMIRRADIRYDSIGVGASAGAKFDELNQQRQSFERVRYAKFNAGAAVERPEEYYASDRLDRIKNKDFFANLKAQAWWNLADRFRNTYNAINRGEKFKDDELVSISSEMPNLEKLKTELSTPKRDFDRNGRVKVESKEDLAKSNRVGGAVKSPNLADAFVMAFAAPVASEMIISAEVLAAAMR
ncbi:MAG: PBSX family phage terminase large subunit [Patescibacteria group bacterium]|nr:PBSX family phage terminase large subunit [Patescibacteria group bacterium]